MNKNLIETRVTLDVDFILDTIFSHILDTEDTLTIRKIAAFMRDELIAWEGTKADETNIIEAIRLLQEIK